MYSDTWKLLLIISYSTSTVFQAMSNCVFTYTSLNNQQQSSGTLLGLSTIPWNLVGHTSICVILYLLCYCSMIQFVFSVLACGRWFWTQITLEISEWKVETVFHWIILYFWNQFHMTRKTLLLNGFQFETHMSTRRQFPT